MKIIYEYVHLPCSMRLSLLPWRSVFRQSQRCWTNRPCAKACFHSVNIYNAYIFFFYILVTNKNDYRSYHFSLLVYLLCSVDRYRNRPIKAFPLFPDIHGCWLCATQSVLSVNITFQHLYTLLFKCTSNLLIILIRYIFI